MTAKKIKCSSTLQNSASSWQGTLEILGTCHKLSRLDLDMAGKFGAVISVRERELGTVSVWETFTSQT